MRRNSDESLRSAERIWSFGGDLRDRVRLLVERLRQGFVTQDHLSVAGWLGDEAARLVIRPWAPLETVPKIMKGGVDFNGAAHTWEETPASVVYVCSHDCRDDPAGYTDAAMRYGPIEWRMLASLTIDMVERAIPVFESRRHGLTWPRAAVEAARVQVACPCSEHLASVRLAGREAEAEGRSIVVIRGSGTTIQSAARRDAHVCLAASRAAMAIEASVYTRMYAERAAREARDARPWSESGLVRARHHWPQEFGSVREEADWQRRHMISTLCGDTSDVAASAIEEMKSAAEQVADAVSEAGSFDRMLSDRVAYLMERQVPAPTYSDTICCGRRVPIGATMCPVCDEPVMLIQVRQAMKAAKKARFNNRRRYR